MKQKLLIILVVFSCLFLTVVSAQQKTVSFYSSDTCPHCQAVKDSGIIQTVSSMPDVSFTMHTLETENGYAAYYAMRQQNPDIPQGVPLMVIECDGKTSYIIGDTPIISNLEQAVTECKEGEYAQSNNIILFLGIAGIIGAILFYTQKKREIKA